MWKQTRKITIYSKRPLTIGGICSYTFVETDLEMCLSHLTPKYRNSLLHISIDQLPVALSFCNSRSRDTSKFQKKDGISETRGQQLKPRKEKIKTN